MIHKLTDLKFYENFYNEEQNRKNRIDNSISFPTTLLTLLVAGGIYIFESDKVKILPADNVYLIACLVILIALYLGSMIITVVALMRMYLNIFSKYHYLPSPHSLKKREIELYNHYNEYFQKSDSENPKEETHKFAKEAFENDLLNYYIESENSISKCDSFPFKDKKSRFFIFERESLNLLHYGQKEL